MLFKKKLPTAAVFVDFEHWCYSMDNLYHQRPQIRAVFDQLKTKYRLERVYFFGDFTQPKLRIELDLIREITSQVIDTQNASEAEKKDFTDFILLDHLYQDADKHKKTDAYVIFSGDGHFSSAAAYLKVNRRKFVEIYGVSKAISNKLKCVASAYTEVPLPVGDHLSIYRMIIKNLEYLTHRSSATYPTFRNTARQVAAYNHVSENDVVVSLRELLDQGIVYQKTTRVRDNKKIRYLQVDWNKASQNGLMEEKV